MFWILIGLIIILPLNYLVYGLANKRIAIKSEKNPTAYKYWGLLGGFGMIVTLIGCVKPTFKKIMFGVLRFILIMVVIFILFDMDSIVDGSDYSGLNDEQIMNNVYYNLFFYFFATPFILRGKYVFDY
jgi:hypothetical protein